MIDFRSDTVTKPTKEMRHAMANALVGDDVYQDDPTIIELEELAARMTGKESAIFVPSGTFGNQVAIMSHTQRGDEIIVGTGSHIKNYEVGATAVLSSVSFHLIKEVNGMMPLTEVKSGIRGLDVHYPTTSLICVENAHGSGVVLKMDYLKELYSIAQDNNLKVHMDGARLFNAATFLNVAASEICQYTDSVTFCLSKGLAAPIGSILCGTTDFINIVRRNRKMLGGGMRQVGILGAAGLISLKDMTKRLNVDHENAKYLANELNKFSEITVDYQHLDINMLFIKGSFSFEDLYNYLLPKGILIGGYKGESLRLAIHNDISLDDIELLIKEINNFLK
ncbi:MAG: low-specificity L-threonine aldolase [Candidatus Izemoplasma sp.]